MGFHRELYNILLFHLGETSARGKKEIPKDIEFLKRDLGNLLSYTYAIGKSCGMDDIKEKYSKIQNIDSIINNCKEESINICLKSKTANREMKDLFDKAVVISSKFHEGQLYGDGEYTDHLEQVCNVIEQFATKDNDLKPYLGLLKICGRLHDIVEDTEFTKEELYKTFGSEIFSIVYAVTNEPGNDRAEKHKKTYPKIRGGGIKTIALKLADRIANVTNCINTKNKLIGMYQKEHKGFVDYFRTDNQLNLMWNHLEDLMVQSWKLQE